MVGASNRLSPDQVPAWRRPLAPLRLPPPTGHPRNGQPGRASAQAGACARCNWPRPREASSSPEPVRGPDVVAPLASLATHGSSGSGNPRGLLIGTGPKRSYSWTRTAKGSRLSVVDRATQQASPNRSKQINRIRSGPWRCSGGQIPGAAEPGARGTPSCRQATASGLESSTSTMPRP